MVSASEQAQREPERAAGGLADRVQVAPLSALLFGLTVPLGLRSRAGLLIPGLFAIGTSVPLLAYAGLVAMGSDLGERYLRRLGRGHGPVRKIAGVIFLLVGINDTLTYWFL